MGLKDLFKKKEQFVEENVEVKKQETDEVKAESVVKEEISTSEPQNEKEKPAEAANIPNENKKNIEVTEERRKEIWPIILKDEVEESDFDGLTIQETIFLLCGVDNMNEKSEVVNYEQKCEMIDRVLAKKLAEAETLYMTFDRVTRYPFITQGCVEIYSEMAFAQDAVKHYSEQYRALEIRVIRNGKSGFPDDMKVFEYLHYLGMEHILLDNGKFKTVVECQDVFPMELNEEKNLDKPIMNPKLRFAIVDFFEEVRWPVSYEQRDEVMKTKEDKMLNEIKEARLLVPMCFDGEKVTTPQTQMEFQSDRKMILPKLQTKDQVEFTPVFTDWTEFTKIYQKDQWNGLVLTFDQIVQIGKKMGLVINPLGENLIMNQQSFEALDRREEQPK